MMGGMKLNGCAAVITGASSGLGREFARQLAGRADRLLLVARGVEAMEALKAELVGARAALRVEICGADLGKEAGRARVVEWVRVNGFSPDVLINNAGLGDYGAFKEAKEERLREQMEVNMSAVVALSHGLLPYLRRPGGILNVSSLAGELPMPELAVYGASKAFVTSFSEALAVELEAEGVTVACVCPGPTPTQFGSNARRADGGDTNRSGQDLLKQPPEKVVAAGLRALETGSTRVFPGAGVALAARVFRLMPLPMLRWMLRRRLRAGR
jgi:short-subunit dehydrogenase